MKKKLSNITACILAVTLSATQPVSAAAFEVRPNKDIGIIIYPNTITSNYFTVSKDALTAEADGTMENAFVDVSYTKNGSGFRVEVDEGADWIRIGRSSAVLGSLTFYGSSGRFYVAASKNTGGSERKGTIKVTASDNYVKTIQVTQKGLQAQLQVSTDELAADADGTLNTSYIDIDTKDTGGVSVEASSTGNWLRVGRSSAVYTGTSLKGSGRIYISASENKETSDRQGTITITHAESGISKTVTVVQKAVQTELFVHVTELTADADGNFSTNYIEVDTKGTGGVSAQASSTGNWLKIGRGSAVDTSTSLRESGRIYVAASRNRESNDRTGTITITHSDGSTEKKVTVTQKAAVSNLTLNTDRLTAQADGTLDNSYIEVNTDGTGGFKAQASSSGDWLKIGKRSGSSTYVSYDESGRIYVSVSKNTESSDRTGTITITHENGTPEKTVAIVQKALQTELLVSETSLTAEAGGKMPISVVNVDTNGTGGFEAKVSDSASWLKIGKNLGDSSRSVSYTASGKLYIAAAKNETTSTRTATITITHENGNAEKTIEVKQDPAKEEITVSRSELVANAAGKIASDSVKVSTKKTGGCEVSTEASWIKIGKSRNPSSNDSITLSDGDTFYVTAEKNVGDDRTGTITVTHQNGVAKAEVTVKQDGVSAKLTVDNKNITANKDGSFYNKTVSVSTGSTGGFRVKVADSRWLKISKDRNTSFDAGYSELSFEEDAKFYLIASENTSEERTAEITVTHENGSLTETIIVKQVGDGEHYLTMYTDRADFYEPTSAKSGAISVGADDDTHWVAETSNKWIHISEYSYSSSKNSSLDKSGSGTFYIYVDANNSLDERVGRVTVSVPGMSRYEIRVTQVGKEKDLHELLENTTIRLTRQTFSKGLTSQIKFTYPEGLARSDIQKIVFASNKKRVAVVNKNGKITPKKKGTAMVYARVYLYDGYSKQFKVKAKVGKRKVTTVVRKK